MLFFIIAAVGLFLLRAVFLLAVVFFLFAVFFAAFFLFFAMVFLPVVLVDSSSNSLINFQTHIP